MNERGSFPDVFGTDGPQAHPLVDRRDPHYLAHREEFHLGKARISPALRRIEGPAATVVVEPRVMQVLLALSDAAGGVLTRDDLIRLCWKGQVVGDDSINRAVKELRRAIRESGADFTVDTIPRVGFRIEQPAHRTPGDIPSSEEVGANPAGSGPAPGATRRHVIGGALVAVAGGAAWWATRPAALDPVSQLMQRSQTAMSAGTPEMEQAAIAMLEDAVAKAPRRADAWGLLALTRARAVEHLTVAPEMPHDAVSQAADRALSLDPDNSDARAAMAIATPYFGDWLEAEKRFTSAITANPDHVFLRDSYSFFLGAVGRMRESARTRLDFVARAPLDAALHFRQGYAHWFLGQIEEADRILSRGLEMWPRHPGLWFGRLWVMSSTGRLERAGAQIADTAARPPLPPPMFDTLAQAIAAAQGRDAAQRKAAAQRLLGGASANVTGVVNALMALNLVGAVDEAFALSEAYYLERGPLIAAVAWRPGQPRVPDQRRRKSNMLFTPTAAPMQRDPRFLPLVEKMGLGDYWRRSGSNPDFLEAGRG